jgi:hypothetical protein
MLLLEGVQRPPPVEWRCEDDRLVCRTATGDVVATLAPEGGRFGRIAAGPANCQPNPENRFGLMLLDLDARRLLVLSVPKEQVTQGSVPCDSREPIATELEARPLRPADRPAGEWMPYVGVADGRLLAFLPDGSVLGEAEMRARERVTGVADAWLIMAEGFGGLIRTPEKLLPAADIVVGVETEVGPCPPDTSSRRFLLFRVGQPPLVREFTLAPARAAEILWANLAAAFALLRPPPLAVLSALSAPPGDPREVWWWRDPWLAGGRYSGWLGASVALAALLAWRARRRALERCATRREAGFWTVAVFLLGPIGALWMRFVLPAVPVETVGGARRAVNLDAPWPEPKPQGIEVFS